MTDGVGTGEGAGAGAPAALWRRRRATRSKLPSSPDCIGYLLALGAIAWEEGADAALPHVEMEKKRKKGVEQFMEEEGKRVDKCPTFRR